jgi:tRNA pseudouridine55 synthase
MTSHDVVNRLRKITGERSIGHLGTLDPMATGVLPMLVGKYTRLAQYFSAAEKSYRGEIHFGFSTDTWDAEGQPAGPDCWPEMATVITVDRVRAAAVRFHGEIEQMPPQFSAKKINGKPAYKLARAGKPVDLKPAKIRIDSFDIAALEGSVASFTIDISSGGYVRSVAHELGRHLGCGAHLSRLRRTRAGMFTLEDAHTLEELEALAGKSDAVETTMGATIEAVCVHPRLLLLEMPSVSADTMALGRLRNGAQANLPEFSGAPLVKVFSGPRELAAIAKRVAGTLFQPVVVMG